MPNRYARACNSQFPLFSQNMQKWLPSTKSISMRLRRWALSASELLSTMLPATAGCVHAAAGRPLTMTVQIRQLPCGVSPFMAQRRGM